jgi:Ca2+-binding RTX toxin-like protein
MRWRAILLVAAMLVVLAAVGGVALAVTINGTSGDDRLRGSNGRDQISGNRGDDVIWGLRSMDTLNGGRGDDVIRVFNSPAAQDVVFCGDGFDRAVADARDVLAGCNRVTRP